MHRALLPIILLLALLACQAPQPLPTARPWPAGSALFQQDPRWLGGDAAYSIPLGPERRLWLFGDTFIGQGDTARAGAAFIHNSLAVQHGSDAGQARMQFAWSGASGNPQAFFQRNDGQWYWPGHGIRLAEGPLLIFLYRVKAAANALGFATQGVTLARIRNPDTDPADWSISYSDGPALPFDALPGAAVLRDGDTLLVLAVRQQGTHAGTWVRYRISDLLAGQLDHGQWWSGHDWQAAASLPAGPAWVMTDAGSEASVHFDDCLQAYVHVASYGFGTTHIGLRTAPAPTGPWSTPVIVYMPPESQHPGVFTYAGKSHPGLAPGSPCELALSYATNHTDPQVLFTAAGITGLYWPRLLRLSLPHP